ncbi:hypothetical protein ACOSQ3_006997 [Xanthoceras sorbifolium]
MTVSVNSAADRKKKGTEDEHFSIIEETKVVSGELENNCLDTTGVADLLVVNMEKLEGAVSNGPDVQIRFALTPKKSNTQKWKRAARKGSSQSALEDKFVLGMCCFRQVLDDCELINLGFSGPKMTWNNKLRGFGVAKQLGFFVALVEVDASTVVEGINLLKPSLSIAGFVINDIRALSSEVGIQKC